MPESEVYTPIEVQVVDNAGKDIYADTTDIPLNVVIPQGMTPIYVHSLAGQWIAHVTGWTTARQYDSNKCDLYPLTNKNPIVIDHITQAWYHSFGEPAKEGMKDASGNLHVRERVR